METHCRVGDVAIRLPEFRSCGSLPDPLTFEDGSSIVITTEHAGAANHYYIGATLGQNWSAMPAKQHVNWQISGPKKFALDVTGDVYLTGPSPFTVFLGHAILSRHVGSVASHTTRVLLLRRLSGYWPVASPMGWQWKQRELLLALPIHDPIRAVRELRHRCPALSTSPGGGIENGVLRLLDGHGGANGAHVLSLEAIRGSGESHSHYHLYFVYVPPGRYRNPSTGAFVDRFPGDTFTIDLTADGFAVYPIAKVVQFVSADISAASPGGD